MEVRLLKGTEKVEGVKGVGRYGKGVEGWG